MQQITTVSIIVIAANALTGITSAVLLMLIFWQNPRARINQLFSITMLGLALYSIFNIMSRLWQPLAIDPAVISYTTSTLYLVFAVGLFLSTMAFAALDSLFIRALRAGVLLSALGVVYSIWGGYTVADGFSAVPEDPGSIQTELSALGMVALLMSLVYPLITAIILYVVRQRAPRLRGLWQAPVLVVIGILWLPTGWQMTRIPLNAVCLAGAAFVLGRAVLLENLFNPLADLSQELQVKNQQLREADHIKNQFMAKMSHELRTPLNSIIGYTDLILDGLYGDLLPQQTDRLEKVLRNGRNLLNLINDILDLSHIEIGQITLDPEPIPTQELLENALAVVEPQIQHKQLTVIREFADAPAIFADKTRARQIVTNILSNAVKFTHQGHIRVRASARDGMVQFEFEDTGIGIPPEKVDRVFEAFRQIDNTTTREYGGTGLGMSITRRLVEMSGGQIWLKSQVNVGTTFYLRLPQAERQVIATSERPQQVPDATSEAVLKVLVIDDKHDSQMFMRDVFTAERPHWRVTISGSGREGLHKAREFWPDVITLDIMMPSMDGWEVLKKLKADPDLAHIPVVVVSLVDNHPLAYKLGATAIMPKPVERKALIELLEQVAAGQSVSLG